MMSATAQRDHIFTYDDLAALPDDGQRYEIIGGELIVSPAPILNHQRTPGNFYMALRLFVDSRQLGEVFYAPVDVKFSPHNVVEPDVLFIHRDRRQIMHAKAVAGAPDLVMEVLSAGSRRRDLIQKRALYAMAGVPEYWIADPDDRVITVLALNDEQYTEVAPDEAGHAVSTVLPGFSVDPAALFAAPLS